jgi:hypothetical protein
LRADAPPEPPQRHAAPGRLGFSTSRSLIHRGGRRRAHARHLRATEAELFRPSAAVLGEEPAAACLQFMTDFNHAVMLEETNSRC